MGVDAAVEERLLSVLTQLIEQKFRTLTYKELSKMIRLTPLVETESFKEAIKDELVALLLDHIQAKFALSAEGLEITRAELQNLELDSLRALFGQILKIETLEQLELWIADHLPKTQA